MARNVSKSQSFNLYVSPIAATGAVTSNLITGVQLHRLTSIGGPEWNYERQPINVIGKLAAPYKDTTDSPTVTLPFSYYLVDLENEKNLGFNIDINVGCVSGILTKVTDEKNYYVLVAPEGEDAITKGGSTAGVKVIGVGNGVISNYSIEGSVGDYPKANVTVEGLNVRGYDAAAQFDTPAIDPTAGTQLASSGAFGTRRTTLPVGTDGNAAKNYIIRPGDIEVELTSTTGVLTTPNTLNVQSFNVSFDLARNPIQKLGSRYAVSRDITFPVDINFTVEALGGDVRSGNLVDFLCQTATQTATIKLKNPTCDNTGSGIAVFQLKGLTLQSEGFNLDVNDSQTVSITWLGQIGGPSDNSNNLFMSGISTYSP
jgi:hypothetical protein